MRNKMLLLFCLLFIPVMVNAKEYCTVVRGDGKSLGSEMICGTEHFYIISNKDNTLSLLSKYNLNVGDKIDYFDIEGTKPTYNYLTFQTEAGAYCMSQATNKGYHPYYVYAINHHINSTTDELVGCRVYERMNEDHVRQDERAVGTKLVNGKSVLPLYGIVYMNPEWGYEAIHDHVIKENVYDRNGDLVISGSSFEGYLNGYKSELINQGISVNTVSFITLKNTISFLEALSGKKVDVKLEYDRTGNDQEPDFYIGKMDISEYAKKSKWIYDRTYWLGSGFKDEDTSTVHGDDMVSQFNDYYISNEGFLCALGRGNCGYLAYPIGNGLRPLITIKNNIIKFKIKTQTDGHGSIEVIQESLGGESIRFRVNANKGYELQSLIIKTDDTSQVVEFTKGEIIKNKDGTVSIDKNKFTMPFENVTIQARWARVINPETGRNIAILVLLLLTSFMTIMIRKSNNNLEDN